MGKKSTFTGYLRARGNSSNTSRTGPTPAVVPVVLGIRGLSAIVDAGTATGKYLPKGAIPLSVTVVEATTISGGTAPILDVGLELAVPDDDALANGLDYEASSHTNIADALAGALLGTELVADTEVTYGDDGVGVNNTAGTIDIFITYTVQDAGALAD